MKPTGFVKETGDAAARLESAARRTREERIMASGGGRLGWRSRLGDRNGEEMATDAISQTLGTSTAEGETVGWVSR